VWAHLILREQASQTNGFDRDSLAGEVVINAEALSCPSRITGIAGTPFRLRDASPPDSIAAWLSPVTALQGYYALRGNYYSWREEGVG